MFSLGLEILAGTYLAKQFIHRWHKPEPQATSQSKLVVAVKKRHLAKRFTRWILPPPDQATQHYLQASSVSVGLIVLSYIYLPLRIPALMITSYATVPILAASQRSLSRAKFKNDALISLVSIGCFALGNYPTAALATWFYHLGDKMVEKTQNHSETILTEVFGQQPSTAWVRKDEIEIEVALDDVKIDDVVAISMGQVVPIDGDIIEGMAMLDEHVLTGESMPAEKTAGDTVFASTVMLSGKVWVRVKHTGQDTNIAKITDILQHTVEFKTGLQTRAEQITDNIAKPLLGVGAAFMPLVGIPAAMTILYSSPGSDVKVLTSLQTLNHLTLAYQNSILVKDGRALESLRHVDTVLFDKTGTLTSEQPEVGQIITCADFTQQTLLTYVAAAEHKLSHPIALAILAEAEAWNLDLPLVENTQYKMSYGITVELAGQVIKVGSSRFMQAENILLPTVIHTAQQHCDEQGYSLVILAVDQQVQGALEIRPQIRPEADDIIQALRQQGVQYMAIVSGDREKPTQKLAEKLGMDEYFYDFLPQDKANLIEELRKQGKKVCFVGDGINDAIAMKKANVSVSMFGATAIATDTAQVVLMDSGISHLPYLFDISKRLDQKIKETLFICASYGITNLVGAVFLHVSILFSFAIGGVEYGVGVLNARTPKVASKQ